VCGVGGPERSVCVQQTIKLHHSPQCQQKNGYCDATSLSSWGRIYFHRNCDDGNDNKPSLQFKGSISRKKWFTSVPLCSTECSVCLISIIAERVIGLGLVNIIVMVSLFLFCYLQSWGGKENGFGLAECSQDLPLDSYPASATTLHFEFYLNKVPYSHCALPSLCLSCYHELFSSFILLLLALLMITRLGLAMRINRP